MINENFNCTRYGWDSLAEQVHYVCLCYQGPVFTIEHCSRVRLGDWEVALWSFIEVGGCIDNEWNQREGCTGDKKLCASRTGGGEAPCR
jgi:hypothetical protein